MSPRAVMGVLATALLAGCPAATTGVDGGLAIDASNIVDVASVDAPVGADMATGAIDAGAQDADVPEDVPTTDGSEDAGRDAPADDVGVDADVDAAVVDAFVTEMCPTEGMTRGVPCGMCGTRRQTCTGGAWTDSSMCLSEGACMAGASDTRPTFYCVTQTRTCSSSCVWGAYIDDGPRGECAMGDMNPCAPVLHLYGETCRDDCTWGPRDPACH